MLTLKEYDFIIDPIFEPYINKKIVFHVLCENPDAIHFILRNFDKIRWDKLSLNPSPQALHP